VSVARTFLVIGAVLAGVGVAAGAFAAHALAGMVPPERVATFETAARYQVYHALALLVVGLLAERVAKRTASGRALRLAGWLFVAGVALFSGSLYLLVLTDTPALGAVTPLGGVAFIAGWAALAWHSVKGVEE